MAYDINVYLNKKNIPATEEWASAIVDAGFDVSLDTDFDPKTFMGFLPCPVKGQTAGFELYPSEVESGFVKELQLPSNTDFSILFSIHSDPLEMESALAVSSILAKISGGVLDDPQIGISIASKDAVAWAKAKLLESSGSDQGHEVAHSKIKKLWWKFW